MLHVFFSISISFILPIWIVCCATDLLLLVPERGSNSQFMVTCLQMVLFNWKENNNKYVRNERNEQTERMNEEEEEATIVVREPGKCIQVVRCGLFFLQFQIKSIIRIMQFFGRERWPQAYYEWIAEYIPIWWLSICVRLCPELKCYDSIGDIY